MAFNVQRGLQNMFSGLEEDWQKRIDDQAEFERQEKIAQSKMLKQREQYNWEKAQQLESRDAEMARLKAEGESMGYTGPDLARYVNSGGSTIPQTEEEYETALERDLDKATRVAEAKGEVELEFLKKKSKAEQEILIANADGLMEQAFPQMEKGSNEWRQQRNKLLGIQGKSEKMSPEQKRLWFKDSTDYAQTTVDNMIEQGREDELLEQYGSIEGAYQGMAMDYLTRAGVESIGGGTAGPGTRDPKSPQVIAAVATQPKESQEEYFAIAEQEYGKKTADELRKAVADEAKKSDRQKASEFAMQQETALSGFETPAKTKVGRGFKEGIKEDTAPIVGWGKKLWNWLEARPMPDTVGP